MVKTLGFLILFLPFTVQAQTDTISETFPTDLVKLIRASAMNEAIYNLSVSCKKDIPGHSAMATHMRFICNPIHERLAHQRIEELIGPIRPIKNGIFEKTMRASSRSQHIFRKQREMIKKYDLHNTYFDMLKYNLAFYSLYNE